MGSSNLLSVARGDTPADLLLKNGSVLNVFTGEIEGPADIAIAGDRIAGIGRGYDAKQTMDLTGAYVAPGLIDAHVHIESSLCLPTQCAWGVVPRGIKTVVADPPEIANVAGAAGVRFMAEASRGLPLRVILMAPSCVPATDMATSGATLNAEDLAALLNEGVVHGLAEVMNFPGVIANDRSVAAKVAEFKGCPVDGHAPGILGKHLNAYVAAGIGSDHECVTVEEAREKLARGLYILVREATNAHNLDALLPLVTEKNSRRICFCTDDRQPADLLSQGSVDFMVRRAIEFGIDPVTAFRMATLNATEWFQLHDRGAVAPGRLADLIVFDDLKFPRARVVYVGGKAATDSSPRPTPVPPALLRTVNIDGGGGDGGGGDDLDLVVTARTGQIRVIESQPDQLMTRGLVLEPKRDGDRIIADPARDILKMAVIERHRGSGRIGVGFIKGFGMKRGSIAGTVAHDHHNLVGIGCDDESMHKAVRAVRKMNGGYAVSTGATLPLPVAGLMSDRPIGEVRDGYAKLLAAARDLGSPLHDPFMAMSFMALEVIPSLKLTDQGLVDVEAFKKVDLFVE
jgi:adenine deaminase